MKNYIRPALAGLCAGAVTGLFGGGGGMVLIPLLGLLTDLEEESLFPCSVCIIAPICAVCLAFAFRQGTADMSSALPYLLGSGIGGLLCGTWAQRIPVKWLHRVLGLLILWGGVRYLC